MNSTPIRSSRRVTLTRLAAAGLAPLLCGSAHAQAIPPHGTMLEGQPVVEYATSDNGAHLQLGFQSLDRPPEQYTFGWRWAWSFTASWWGWWEFNRSSYVDTKPRPPMEGIDPEPLRRNAADALIAASTPPDRPPEALVTAWDLPRIVAREAAVLALGRIGDGEQTDALIERTNDIFPEVSRAAFYALALLDDERATEFLTSPRQDLEEHEALALVTALGLLKTHNPRALEILANAVAQPANPTVAAQAMWAIAALKPPQLRETAWHVIRNSPRPMDVHYAILALGTTRHDDDIKPLADFAYKIEGFNLPSFRRPDMQISGGGVGYERMDIDPFNQAMRLAAVYALRNLYEHDPYVSYQLQRALDQSRLQTHLTLDHCITLAEIASPAEVAILQAMARGTHLRPFQPPTADTFDPAIIARMTQTVPGGYARNMGIEDQRLRAHAALALGLALRRGVEVAEPYFNDGRPNPSSATGTLARFATTRETPTEVRDAAILALGLAADRRAVPTLIAAAELAAQIDQVGFGYAMIALALLDEPAVLDAAANALQRRADRIDVASLRNLRFDKPLDAESLFARRAIIEALGILGDPRAEPLLIAQWGRDFWTDIQVADSLRRIGSYRIADDLTQLVRTDNPVIQLSAAWSLGVLLERDADSRLNRLIADQPGWPIRSENLNLAIKVPVDFNTPRAVHFRAQNMPQNKMWDLSQWRFYADPIMFDRPLQAGSPHR